MIGYFLAILTGLSLGLLGGGGSILTVPILVYAIGMDPKLSIALSLGIVGTTSLIGVWGHYRAKNIDLKIASIFAPAAIAGTLSGAKLSTFVSAEFQLALFAIIMLAASFFMFRPAKIKEQSEKLKALPLIAQGFAIGILTGLVGVGGGFLIVPGLVLLAGIDMKKAVGTSLFVIALNSLAGFVGYARIMEIPWTFFGTFVAFSGMGILVGTYLSRFVSQEKLKKGFAVFLVLMGIFILYKNRSTIINAVSATNAQAQSSELSLILPS